MIVLPDPLERWANPALIDHLARVRQPWDAPVRRIVRAALAKWLPTLAAPVVEIGAGGGQLREWLPPELAEVTVHTEPSKPFLEVFCQRHPDANILQAEASALPFESSSVGAVLALCVFDTLHDLASVRDELQRVLKPGGVVIHFLDLSTSPDCLFPELIAGGELPLTNFAADPALLDVLTDAQKALLPQSDEFDEVIAVKWEAFRALVGMLERARHPLAAELGPYANLTNPGALDPQRLANGFMAASADPTRLLALNKALLKLTLSARQMGREWPLRSISTRSHLRAKLRSAFSADSGFAVEFAGPVSACELAPAEAETRFILRHAGRTVRRAELPTREYGTPVEELEGVPAAGRARAPDGFVIRETTVEVFAARKGF